jgi:cryptochrome
VARLSCTAFFSQFYRCYSPISFGTKWDPEGHFVRHYVPELKDFDKKYIYEPWKAPIADQKAWGCQIKGDGMDAGDAKGGTKTYPKPMFDFNERRTACLDGMKHAYDIGMYGADKRRLNGEWKKVFGKEDSNRASGKGKKRAREEDEDEGDDSDDGDEADHGDVTGDERPKKAAKKAMKGGRKGQQAKLDDMVSRGKKK